MWLSKTIIIITLFCSTRGLTTIWRTPTRRQNNQLSPHFCDWKHIPNRLDSLLKYIWSKYMAWIHVDSEIHFAYRPSTGWVFRLLQRRECFPLIVLGNNKQLRKVPESATCPTGTPFLQAMWPRMENMAKPEKKLVVQFPVAIIKVSLKLQAAQSTTTTKKKYAPRV